jgi:hypothetical protein
MQTRLQIGRISTFLFRATAKREDAKAADRDLIVIPDAGKS